MLWFRSKKEKNRCLRKFSVICVFILCGILVYISLKYTGQYCNGVSKCFHASSTRSDKLTGNKCTSKCNSQACIYSANFLQVHMNASANPCEDFYSFACGNHLDNFGKVDNYTALKRIMDSTTSYLRDILNNIELDPESATGKMKITYDSCINIGSSEHQAIPSALEFLREIGIDWPNLSPDFEFSNPDLHTVMGYLAAYKEYAFIQIVTSVTDKISDSVFSTVTKSLSFFERSETSTIDNLFHRVLKYFKIEEERAVEIWEDIKAVDNLFKSFMYNETSVPTDCNLGNVTFFHVNCSEDGNEQWKNLCQTMKTFINVANASHLISGDNVLISCANSQFLSLIYSGSMSHRSMANFLAMNFFLSHLEDLSFYFRLTKQQDSRAHDEYDPIPIDRYEHCIRWTTQNMDMALAYEYASKYLTKPALLEVQEMIQEYIKEVGKLISEQNWLTSKQKSYMTRKINNMTISVDLQLEYYFNQTYVENYYKEYHPTSESFLKNILRLQKAYFSSEMLEGQKNGRLHELRPFTVNAHFDGSLMKIGLPILCLPLYLHGRPKFINLMSFAVVIGHEIGHSIFSDMWYLARRNKRLGQNFLPRVYCFINQYSAYPIATISKNVHANSSLGENMSDSIGMTLLDRFIEKYMTSNEVYSLPGLPYSAKQLIYITVSQFWCSKTSKERDKSRYIVNPHIPENLRLIGMLHNSKQFSEVFNCPEGSFMNPVTKCTFLD